MASAYEVVVVTRNRPEALRLSMPRFLRQTLPPSRVIVVDSSDDPGPSRQAVEEASRRSPVEVTFVPAERGMTRQRNVGLEMVRSGIVLFPDDDSMWATDTAAEFVRVYDLDTDGRIGAVCGRPVVGFDAIGEASASDGEYRLPVRDRLDAKVARFRRRLAARTAPDPFVVLGESHIESWEIPAWFTEREVVPVAFMTGFRMSFRTSAIRARRFDETFSNYCLFEDAGASFGIMVSGLMVVAAHRARVYHHRFPGKRGRGRDLGVEQILNRAYVVARHAPPGHPARGAIVPFSKAKCRSYLTRAFTRFGMDRYLGARAATREAVRLASVPPERAAELYLDLRRRLLGK